MTTDSNSIAFLAAHLVQCRHFLAARLGAPLPDPMGRFLDNADSLDDVTALPSIPLLQDSWQAISAHVAVVVERLDEPQLNAMSGQFEGSDGSLLGAFAFLVHHDTYHLGQMAIVRRQLGLRGASGRPA